jgi:uncharacterized protein
MEYSLGRVTNISGAQMTVEADEPLSGSVRIGAMVKTKSGDQQVIGTIASVEAENDGPSSRRLFAVDLLGEIVPTVDGGNEFRRGITLHPIPGAPVLATSDADVRLVYTRPSVSSVNIGTLFHDPTRPAFVLVDEMLAKHFVLGTTGSGKSCALALILSAVLADHPQAHIVVLDPHNEYSKAFGELAETVNVDNLRLPLWLLDFEEAVGVLVRGGTVQEQEAQAIILKDAMLRARRRYAGETLAASSITVDTPMPFGMSDLIRFIDEAMGRLDNPDTSAPYLRLRTRLESLRDDRRFEFMFSERLIARDSLAQIVGRLLRIPVDGKPITIIDLSGIPSEIANVVVSMIGRLIFDFSLWSERERMPPILLVCEEAHRRRTCRVRRDRAGDNADRPRRTQIRGRARADHSAALGTVAPGAVTMRYDFRVASWTLSRPTGHGDGAARCRTRDVDGTAEHAHARGDSLRGRRSTADAYSLQRPATQSPAAQRKRQIFQGLAGRDGRPRVSQRGHPTLAAAEPQSQRRSE